MKTFIAFFFLSSPVFSQDYICKMTHTIRSWQDAQGNKVAEQKQWSGVAISSELILSVAHSITEGVAQAEFPGQTVTAEVVRYDTQRDLALFKTKEPMKAKPAKIASRHPVFAKIIGLRTESGGLFRIRFRP